VSYGKLNIEGKLSPFGMYSQNTVLGERYYATATAFGEPWSNFILILGVSSCRYQLTRPAFISYRFFF